MFMIPKVVSKVLDITELAELEDVLLAELNERMTEILSKLNRSEQIEELLALLGMSDLLKQDDGYRPYTKGKIVVIGESKAKLNTLLAIVKTMGLDKNRFEWYLEYEDAKTFDFNKMQYNPNYSLVMVGPMPHSGHGKGDSGSMIANLEKQSGFPPVVRLGNSNGLKITKSEFEAKLVQALENRMIVAS